MTIQFFPENFKVESTGGGDFIQVPRKDGEAIRVVLLGQAVVGYEYWTTEGKPVRLTEKPHGKPADMREKSEAGFAERVKQFVCFPAFEYGADGGDDGRVGILQVNQTSIISEMYDILTTGDFDPLNIFFKIERKSGKRVSYSVNAISFNQKFTKPSADIYQQGTDLKVAEVLFQNQDEESAEGTTSTTVDVATASTVM
ncbi:DNA binding protein [Leptolyngbya phage Lbo240-yong1]|uniref:DNA binding protein n=1 Tax=Leptolyngbya phage Lbo240-yong1 TaxID=2928836 RepID=A0A9X9E181_9CAUD|nr:DNA binding protein [Leptolyngbya phage Lbo240-yong1]